MDTVTTRAKWRMSVRRARFGAVRCALRDFGTWARSGATPLQCARVAFATLWALA
jgi:hypothetical protein